MSKIDGYTLLACPHCNGMHRRARWGFINLAITPASSFVSKDAPRKCLYCEGTFQLEEMVDHGYHAFPKIDWEQFFNHDKRTVLQKIMDVLRGRFGPPPRPPIEPSPEWVEYPVIC